MKIAIAYIYIISSFCKKINRKIQKCLYIIHTLQIFNAFGAIYFGKGLAFFTFIC